MSFSKENNQIVVHEKKISLQSTDGIQDFLGKNRQSLKRHANPIFEKWSRNHSHVFWAFDGENLINDNWL